MCLTIPKQIKKVSGAEAELSDGHKINVAMITKPQIGDWILVNANLAVSKVSEQEAKEINNCFVK